MARTFDWTVNSSGTTARWPPQSLLYELDPLVLHVSDLGLREENAPVQREGHDVRGDLPTVLLRLEGHDDLVVRVGDELEGGEPVSEAELAHSAGGNVLKTRRGAEEDVGAAPLVRRLLVALLAGAPGQEEPPLEGVAPGSGFVD